jgi:hypothetical protein
MYFSLEAGVSKIKVPAFVEGFLVASPCGRSQKGKSSGGD